MLVSIALTTATVCTARACTKRLGVDSERVLVVSKIDGHLLVAIKVKDSDVKYGELTPKRFVFYLFHIFSFICFVYFITAHCTVYCLFTYTTKLVRDYVTDGRRCVRSFEAVRQGAETIRFQHHIGGAYHVCVTFGFNCVDIRSFYQPYDAKNGEIRPTKKGVDLRLSEWSHLCNIIDTIHASLPLLASVLPLPHHTIFFANENYKSSVVWIWKKSAV